MVMKIAYLITRTDELGGAQIHIRDLSLWMKGQGHEVAVLTGSLGKVTDFLEEQGVSIYEIPDLERAIHPVRDWKAFNQIRDALKDFKPDVLSCHSSKAGLLGRFAARCEKVGVVFTAHGWAFTDGVPFIQRNIYKVLEKIAGYFSDHVITVSEYDREIALKAHIVPERKITAIHNGMPDRPFKAPVAHEGPTRLLMVARIGPQKDHATLFKALSGLMDLSWTLDLIGGGDDTELRSLAIDCNIVDRITFHGERYDVGEFMETRADVYLLISRWEGFPRSILEAMRSGLPVIASDVGGTRESVLEGQTGYVIRPNDAEILAHTLRLVIPDQNLQRELGLAGRARFDANFAFQAMAAKTYAVYGAVDKSGIKHTTD